MARVSNGEVIAGLNPGAAMITVTDRDRTSVRYVQVQVSPSYNQGYQAGDNPHDWGI